MNSEMVDIDEETETTGRPDWRATRSAVRCRVPVSMVSTAGSGISWTPALTIRADSTSRTIAPSILASSRRAVGLNGTSRAKPPVEIALITRLRPSTTSAPVRPRRIRSKPSRSGEPGAIRARCSKRPSRWSALGAMVSLRTTRVPILRGPGSPDFGAGLTARPAPGQDPGDVEGLLQRRFRVHAEAVPHRRHPVPGAPGLGGHHGLGEAEPTRLGQP